MVKRVVFVAFCGIFLFNLNAVWAKCVAQTDKVGAANEYLTIPGIKGAFYCNKAYCGNGETISALISTHEGTTHKNSVYTCHIEGSGDLWRRKEASACKSKYTKLKDDENAHEVMLNPQTGSVVASSDASVVAVSVEACVGYECDSGYIESDGKCIEKKGSNCTNGDGSYSDIGASVNIACDSSLHKVSGPLASTKNLKDNVCTGKCTKDGWDITIKKNGCKEGYVVATGGKKCVESEARREEQRRTEQQRVETDNKKQACTDSGGGWDEKNKKCTCDKNTKHLVLSGDKCVCESADYEFDTASKSCKIKDVVKMEQECTASTAQASGAYWDVEKKVCACDDDSKHFVRGKCEYKPAVIACQKVSGAKWTGTECKCTTAGYVMDEAGTQCVKGDALIKTEGQAASRTKIISLYKKLNGMSNDFQVSVWKNAEGNFNTARLASDSIAAVVLGTTGALVTSNIVKKNQVSSGFEDINCQIGGQTVAGWGDEFSVGMQ